LESQMLVACHFVYLAATGGISVHRCTRTTIQTRLLHKSGFQINKVHYNADFWGLLGSLQIFVNRNTGQKADDGWLIRNRLLRIITSLIEKCIDIVRMGDVIEIICEKREHSIDV